jgi:iron complex transport system substrate-binding protein
LNHRASTHPSLRATFLLLSFGAAFQAASPSRPRAAQNATAPAKESYRTVNDDTGRSIRLATPVRRVVSLSPSMTEIMYALGLQDQLVGDTDYCDYPPEARTKHKVGGVINPSLEEIATLKPDMVLVTSSNRWDTVNALDRLGIPSYAAEPRTLDEIRLLVRHLADVLGKPQAGKALDAQLLRRTEILRQKLAGVRPVRVFFVVWTDPLMSVGQHTFIADALAHAGATSVVDSSQDWPQISLEEMVRLQPEFLILVNNHSEKASRDVEALAERPGWNLLEAVKQRRFAVTSDAVNRPAPRLFAAVEDLARQLHPAVFDEKPASKPAGALKEKN